MSRESKITKEIPDFQRPPDVSVLRNGAFLRLWVAQLLTQIGGNVVLYGLTVLVAERSGSTSALSALFLSFLVPAVVLSPIAGVWVDRLDTRLVLIVANLSRAGAFFLMLGSVDTLGTVLLLNIFGSVMTTLFAPAELSMIPRLVHVEQLNSANGLFTFTLNAAFAIGFALLGPAIVRIAGPEAAIIFVAALFLVAGLLCLGLPAAPPVKREGNIGTSTRETTRTTTGELLVGLRYIRDNSSVIWSLIYLSIAASVVGVMGVLGPEYVADALGLQARDFWLVVLPIGFGVVTGILALNSWGKAIARRTLIEVGLLGVGGGLALLALAKPISLAISDGASLLGDLPIDAGASALGTVIFVAYLAGAAYGLVAIPAQTALQAELPEEVRGRVFGVLNMLVSLGSFVPIIAVGPIADQIGGTNTLLGVGIVIAGVALLSITRGPKRHTAQES
jgi:MFS family permease